MMRRGFTLIELLVVIAIIAILAAILFPVFAQARLAAQGAASISNARQISTGMLLYAGDYDDIFPIATAWNTGNDPIVFNGNGVSTWVTGVMPYIRTAELFDDPLGPGSSQIADLPPTAAVSIQSTYGYNYRAMSPVIAEGGIVRQTPRGQTAAANPSNTVLLVSKFASSEWNQGVDQVFTIPGIGGDAFDFGPALNVTVEPPLGQNTELFPGVGFSNWGLGSNMETQLGITERNGGTTGGVAFRRTDNAIVAFLDGSVRTQNRGQLAAGTNWNPQINAGAMELVDPTQYQWDLN